MPAVTDYQCIRSADWRLLVLAGTWDDVLQKRVISLVDKQPWAKHPQTISMQAKYAGGNTDVFLKIFHPNKSTSAWKNWLLRSKALRAWRQGILLTDAGFNVPVTLAAGERRSFGVLKRAFILTHKVAGRGTPLFLQKVLETSSNRTWLNVKRDGLRQLAALIRRFHECGFVHGDLLATNIFIDRATDDHLTFVLMDNDRTKRYPRWLPHSLWKRNLVQLNRLPLPGITLQDRIRFFSAYLGKSKLNAAERNLLRWFERTTRRRRMECDNLDASGDFRRLMHWTRDVDMERS